MNISTSDKPISQYFSKHKKSAIYITTLILKTNY